jgi:hypothetical protein
MSVLSRRYPGIELPEVPATLMAIPSGIKRINWLTFLGESLAKEIGNLDSLIAGRHDYAISVERLPYGMLLVAGAEPRVGDVNRQEDLGPYHKVGAALAQLRSHDHPPFLINANSIPDEEITDEWLAYFDR